MRDAIDLTAAEVHGSPSIADWPITTTITAVEVNHRGVIVSTPKLDGAGRWPDFTPPGWDGPLQYTLWIGMERFNGWHVAAALSFWYGRGTHHDDAGGDVLTPDQIGKNWLYDGRYGSMRYAQPIVGERVAFFVAAGGQRFDIAPIETVRERSNVVTVAWPTEPRIFAFEAPVPSPPPAPSPQPPSPNPPEYVAAILNRLDRIESALVADLAKPAPVYKGALWGYPITLKPEK